MNGYPVPYKTKKKTISYLGQNEESNKPNIKKTGHLFLIVYFFVFFLHGYSYVSISFHKNDF